MDINSQMEPDDVADHSAAGPVLVYHLRGAEATWAAFQKREGESNSV